MHLECGCVLILDAPSLTKEISQALTQHMKPCNSILKHNVDDYVCHNILQIVNMIINS